MEDEKKADSDSPLKRNPLSAPRQYSMVGVYKIVFFVAVLVIVFVLKLLGYDVKTPPAP